MAIAAGATAPQDPDPQTQEWFDQFTTDMPGMLARRAQHVQALVAPGLDPDSRHVSIDYIQTFDAMHRSWILAGVQTSDLSSYEQERRLKVARDLYQRHANDPMTDAAIRTKLRQALQEWDAIDRRAAEKLERLQRQAAGNALRPCDYRDHLRRRTGWRRRGRDLGPCPRRRHSDRPGSNPTEFRLRAKGKPWKR